MTALRQSGGHAPARRSVAALAAALAAACALACGGDASGTEGDGPPPPPPPPPPAGTSGLTVTFTGLPSGMAADATITGPGGFSRIVSASQTITALTAGEYTIASRTVPASSDVQTYDPSPTDVTFTLAPDTIETREIAYKRTGYPLWSLWFNLSCVSGCPWTLLDVATQWRTGDALCGYMVIEFRSQSSSTWTTLLSQIGYAEGGISVPPGFSRNGYSTNTGQYGLQLPPEPIAWRIYPVAPSAPDVVQPPYGAHCGYITPNGGRYWYPVEGGYLSGTEPTPVNPGPMGHVVFTTWTGPIKFRRF